MIHFLLLSNKQGKIRLEKWYSSFTTKEKSKIKKELISAVSSRDSKACNFIEWKDFRIIYRRYASLYFIVCTNKSDNELITLEIIHIYALALDKYFTNVCELDLIFNFEKAYHLLDELLIAGEMQETSVNVVVKSTIENEEPVITQGQIRQLEQTLRDAGLAN